MKELVITDLDDTLYNWLGFFVPSFYAMVNEVHKITGLDTDLLLDEYKEKHTEYGSVEYPYITLQLPSIIEKYPSLSRDELKQLLNEAFHVFNSERKKRLVLFNGVSETLKELYDNEITIIGYTESSQENGYYRLKKLGIDKFFKHVYATKSSFDQTMSTPEPKIKSVFTKKPDKDVLLDICAQENCDTSKAIYVGDSLTKDILMAINAGIDSVWVNYKIEENDYYAKLVRITGWTKTDFEKQELLKKYWTENNLHPTYTITSFSELSNIVLTCS